MADLQLRPYQNEIIQKIGRTKDDKLIVTASIAVDVGREGENETLWISGDRNNRSNQYEP